MTNFKLVCLLLRYDQKFYYISGDLHIKAEKACGQVGLEIGHGYENGTIFDRSSYYLAMIH